MKLGKITTTLILILCCLISVTAYAHGVDDETQSFLTSNKGVAFGPFLYIGAKHMITGYDHLLFLVGVIFFLYRTKEIITYVTYFTIGHSATLLLGVMADINVNAYLIDSIIGLSIVYKGFDNLGGFKRIIGKQPNTKRAVLIFGLFHGFGLATKLQEFEFDKEGLFTNLLGFNLGVEIGQFLALGFVLLLISFWRQHKSYIKFSKRTNILLMAAGFFVVWLSINRVFYFLKTNFIMSTYNQPNLSKGQILKSLFIAILIGAVVLVTAVLPAEYGIDPIGTGELFGFSKLYQGEKQIENNETISSLNFKKLKMEKLGSPINTPRPSEANNPPPENQYPIKEDTIKVVVPGKKGIEYKFKSLKYGSTKYEWTTDKGIVYIDFHGEVKQDNPPKNVFYESYTLAYSNNMAGTFTAPFEGKHGWYFRNETNEDIIVTIRLKGQYVLFK